MGGVGTRDLGRDAHRDTAVYHDIVNERATDTASCGFPLVCFVHFTRYN